MPREICIITCAHHSATTSCLPGPAQALGSPAAAAHHVLERILDSWTDTRHLSQIRMLVRPRRPTPRAPPVGKHRGQIRRDGRRTDSGPPAATAIIDSPSGTAAPPAPPFESTRAVCKLGRAWWSSGGMEHGEGVQAVACTYSMLLRSLLLAFNSQQHVRQPPALGHLNVVRHILAVGQVAHRQIGTRARAKPGVPGWWLRRAW